MFELARFFRIDPELIWSGWDYFQFLDGLEHMRIINEVERRKSEAATSGKK